MPEEHGQGVEVRQIDGSNEACREAMSPYRIERFTWACMDYEKWDNRNLAPPRTPFRTEGKIDPSRSFNLL